jgi:hypothetical protein
MKEEQKRFLKEQSVPSTPPSDLNPQLAKVQAGYNKAVSGLNVDKARGVLTPLSQHIKRLEGLKQAYVKKGAIEDALGVKAVLDGAKEEYRLVRATIRETAVKANDAMKIPEPGKAKWISKDATYKASSMYKGGDVSLAKPSPALLSYEGPRLHRNFNVHTQNTTEKNPHIIIDLGKLKTINRIYIENRTGGGMEKRATELTVWISPYEKFNQRFIWQAEEVKTAWTVDLEKPEKARYIKIGLLGKRKNLHLNHVKIYGFENPASPK